jgi:hypothetical protein
MGIERVLGFGVDVLRKDPKAALLGILKWIPSALLSLLVLQAFADLGASGITMQKLVGDPSVFLQMFGFFAKYLVFAAPLFIADVVISLLLVYAYMEMARQARGGKHVQLSKAILAAKTGFIPLLWTYVLETVIIVLATLALFVLGAFGGDIGIMLAFITFLAGIVFFEACIYVTPAVVAIEKRSGMPAVRRSYEIVRHNFWKWLAIILVSVFASFVVSISLSSIPYVGFVLNLVAGLFLEAWLLMMPAAFYYEYAKLARKKH